MSSRCIASIHRHDIRRRAPGASDHAREKIARALISRRPRGSRQVTLDGVVPWRQRGLSPRGDLFSENVAVARVTGEFLDQ